MAAKRNLRQTEKRRPNGRTQRERERREKEERNKEREQERERVEDQRPRDAHGDLVDPSDCRTYGVAQSA